MEIAIIGTGYVGLVTGVCLAAKGHKVTCIDKKRAIVDGINSMKSPIYEPGLEEILRQVVSSGNLRATMELKQSVQGAEVSIIAVGTPFGQDGIDLSYIQDCAREIGESLRDVEAYHLVCVKSTVVPTTTDTIVKDILTAASGKKPGEFGLAMNPEFLREGKAVEDFMFPDRIVIGAYDNRSFEVMRDVYAGHFDAPIIQVNLRTAEMIKYTANALLATLISFSNEIASICEATSGIDVKEVLTAVTLDKRFNPRIGQKLIHPEMNNYLQAGCGFGGSCFPKDVKALISYSKEKDYTPQIIQSTIDVNNQQPLRILGRLELALGTLEQKNIAVLGLAFKPGTDDVRESPSIALIKGLLAKRANVIGVDPVAIKNMGKIIPPGPSILYTTDYQNALLGADAVLLVTSWPEFIDIPIENYIKLMKHPLVVDCRRVLDRAALTEMGGVYIGVGLV